MDNTDQIADTGVVTTSDPFTSSGEVSNEVTGELSAPVVEEVESIEPPTDSSREGAVEAATPLRSQGGGRQGDMYSVARGILVGKYTYDAINDAVDVIRGYHGSGLRDASGGIKFEVTDAVRAVLGSACSTAVARLLVATLYPRSLEEPLKD